MKPKRRQLAALFHFLCAAAAPLAAQTVSLYVSPEPDAIVIGEVPQGDERLMLAAPVADSTKAEAGWLYVTLEADFQGFAQTADVEKFGAGDGLPIYAQPYAESSLITIAEAKEHVELGEKSGTWQNLTVTKPLTVYYNEKGPQPSAAALQDASQLGAGKPVVATPPAPKSAGSSGRTLDASDPAIAAAMGRSTGAVTPAPEATTRAPVAKNPAPAKVGSGSQPVPQSSGNQPDTTARTMQGTFGPAKGGWFSAAPYPYALYDGEGRRIVYVDISGALLSRPLIELNGLPVTAYGLLENTGKRGLVLKARLISTY